MSETSQEKTEKEVLVEEAKSLKIQGAHLCGEDKLKEKIAEKKAEMGIEEQPKDTGERMVAPKMVMANINDDTRTKKAREIEARFPGAKCVFKRNGTSEDELRAVGLRSIGEHLKNDMICITDKESFEEWQGKKNEAQRRKMDAVDSIGNKIKSQTAQAKTPPKQDRD
jgi:hypothetical protein